MLAADRAVRLFVKAGTDLTVIPANENAPAPRDAYATVVLISEVHEGVTPTAQTFDGDQTSGRSVAVIRATYSVQFFRQGAQDKAALFRMWAETPLAAIEAERVGLTYGRCGPVRQLDALVSSAWEPRAGIDLIVGYVQDIEQRLGRIERVDLTANRTETAIDISTDT